MHLSCIKISTISKRTKTRFHLCLVTSVHLGASKTVTDPMVRLAQTMQLSYTDTNTNSKRTKTRFAMTHVTKEFHRVRPKWFSSLWYVWHKLCIYFPSRLALSPNGPKWASTSASSPRSTIGYVPNDFWGHGSFGANHAPILSQN
jgi:hypothetical protein